MSPRPRIIAIAALLLTAGALQAQQETHRTGPLIHSAGPTYAVPDPDFATPLDMTYRVAFEVAAPPEAPDRVNPQLVTVARFLNMHARAGVPAKRLRVAVVVHGPAGRALLQDAAYRRLEGVANPNLPLLRELADAGARLILCGQTVAARGLPRDELAEPVEVALSAMTALLVLGERGYHLNPF